ncbi:hypothetical protein [Enorma burkinafasonensis]|uniref:hypothetical protein n=1 Tax=Enorma burkinafasonensis TaxID=2590867 RepID=UPI0026ECB6AE|nr:hypothetical protein [Enorma burkinafasonensis]MCI7729809.1 hypothetical protein [Enorma burkinafasonensis]
MKSCRRNVATGSGCVRLAVAVLALVFTVLVAPVRAYAEPVEVTSWDALAIELMAQDAEVVVTGKIEADSVIVIDGSPTITFQDATITRTSADAGIRVSGGEAMLTGAAIVTGGSEGFISVDQGASLVLVGSLSASGVKGSESFLEVSGNLRLHRGAKVSGWRSSGDGGGIHADGGTIEMLGGEISGNSARRGGGVCLTNGASMTVTAGSISSNTAGANSSSSYGAGVYVGKGCSFEAVSANSEDPIQMNGNKAQADDYAQTEGGAIYAEGEGTMVTLTGATFEDNRAMSTNARGGGAVNVADGVLLNVTDCTFTNNTSFLDGYTGPESGGGTFFIDDGCAFTLTNSTITGGKSRYGGGINLYGSDMTVDISGCTISECVADAAGGYNPCIGGAIFVKASGQSTISISGTDEHPMTISGNEATQGGGGVCVLAGTVEMDGVSVTDNESPLGGGIYVEGYGALTLDGCEVTGNTASNGAGVYTNGDLNIIDTAIDDNSATGAAGGVYTEGAVTLTSGSISGNTAPEAAGVAVVSHTFDMLGGSISGNVASSMAGGVENGGTFTMSGGDITANQANGATDGIGGGVANLGTFSMEGGRIFDNAAAYGANDFYNYVDGGSHGTFTLADPGTFNLGVDGWYEDEPNARYATVEPADRVEYTIKTNDTSEQYLTLGDPVTAGTLTLEPQDMVAYTGGDSMDGDNFPEVRYKVTADAALTEALGGQGITMQVMVDGQPVALSDAEATVGEDTVIIPELGAMFTLEDSESDDDEVAGVYDISITGTVTAVLSDGRLVDVVVATADGEPATLTVRTVSNAGDAAGEGQVGVVAANPVTVGDAATGAQDPTIATATVDAGARFYTNGDIAMGLLGTDASDPDAGARISLLFDDLLPAAGGTADDTVAALAARAGIDATNAEFKYLDLINEHDGNAWVSTDSDVTVSWPVPQGVDADEVEFAVYHFQGLHREYGGAGSPDAADQIAACQVEVIPCEVVDGRVVFTLDGDAENGCFSPFALTWSAPGEGGEQPGGEQPGGGQQPGGTQPGQQACKPAGSGAGAGTLAATGDSTMVVIGAVLAAGAVAVVAGVVLRRRSAQR